MYNSIQHFNEFKEIEERIKKFISEGQIWLI